MSAFIFDIPLFRLDYPQFSDTVKYPDAVLEQYWENAGCYINNSDNNCWMLQGDCRYQALTLMTAHLTAISALIAAGQTPGLVQSATIDKVSVSLTPPPLKNQWQWWLSTTPYGQRLLALLQVVAVGGLYIGGAPELSAFRKVGGFF